MTVRLVLDVANVFSVVGTFIPAKHCARIFKEQGTGGSIVMIASMSGQIANRVCSCHIKFLATWQTNSDTGLNMHRIQLIQGRRAPDVPLRGPGMGPVWHPCQHIVCWGMSSILEIIVLYTNNVQYIRTAMTDALLVTKPEVEETWMRGALLNRLGVPDDFKAPTVYMLADGSGFMTGADLRVDGGHCASA